MVRPLQRRQDRATAIAAVYGLLALVFLARLFISAPGLGLPYLAVFPIVLACFVLGRTHALISAALAVAIFVVTQELAPGSQIDTGAFVVGAIGRAAVFFGLALVVSALLDRETDLRHQLAESERERTELESLRAALTPPELPDLAGLSVATSYTPAHGLVAGDFFLVAPGPRGSALLVVGDVVGHGLAAAQRAAFVRTTIALFAEYTEDPLTILRLANTALTEREPGSEYVTALCASFAPDRGTLTWASAGHPPPWDLDRGEPLASARNCTPLGVEPALHGEAATTRLRPGAGVLLYTDGLTEARPAARMNRHDLFGEEAAQEALRRLRGASPSEIVSRLSAAALEHADGAPADDLCLVAVRCLDGAAPAQRQAA
ncbi:MAG: hypothetical protein QOC78_1101 [Solirubrobacteraceae bacterium]|jgi:serine phosphatase RsbU (regulator of sigma subunit)|nr:hypothetical protein [Solirubrobacteraceae bacterium]